MYNPQIGRWISQDPLGIILPDEDLFERPGESEYTYAMDGCQGDFSSCPSEDDMVHWNDGRPVVAGDNRGESNLYQYVHNAPTNFVDPSGTEPDPLDAAGIAALGATGNPLFQAPSVLRPDYFKVDPGKFKIRSSNSGTDEQPYVFRLKAKIIYSSAQYRAVDQEQKVYLLPIEAISQPNEKEDKALFKLVSRLGWGPAAPQRTLRKNSLIIRSYQALCPLDQAADREIRAVGAQLFLENKSGLAGKVRWIQFVTTNDPGSPGKGLPANPANTPFVDNKGRKTPFYDGFGEADGTGFSDVPAHPPQDKMLTWQADVFPVQVISQPSKKGKGQDVINIIWPGIHWGWETKPV